MVEVLSSPLSHRNEGHSQVEVCNICGDKGFLNALINCSECCETLVHQYCIGIPPGSIDDSFNWLCESCVQMECEPCSSTKSGGASSKGKGRTKKRNRERGPSLLPSEMPLTLGSKCKRIRKEKTEDQSLSSTTKVAVGTHSNGEDDCSMDCLLVCKMNCSSRGIVYCDKKVNETTDDEGKNAIIPVVDQPEPLFMLLPIKNHQSSEEEEETKCGSHLLDYWDEPEGMLSSLMENPEELMRGIVLLVSPSGEVFIHEIEDSGLWDEDSVNNPEELSRDIVLLVSPSGEVFFHEDVGPYDEGSGRTFKQVDPSKMKFESSPTVGQVVHNYGLIGEKCIKEEADVLDIPFLGIDEDIDRFCDEVTDFCQSNMEDKTVKSTKPRKYGSTGNRI